MRIVNEVEDLQEIIRRLLEQGERQKEMIDLQGQLIKALQAAAAEREVFLKKRDELWARAVEGLPLP